MFEVLMIAASRVLLVLIGFKIYRYLSVWKGLHEPLIGRNGAIMKITLAGQKGFVRVGRHDKQRKPLVKRIAYKDIRTPWGW